MAGSRRNPPMKDQRRAFNEHEEFVHGNRDNETNAYQQRNPFPPRRRDRERPGRGRGGASSGHPSAFRRRGKKGGNNRATSPPPHSQPIPQEQRDGGHHLESQIKPQQFDNPLEPPSHPHLPKRKRRRSPSPSGSRRHRPSNRGNGGNRDRGRGGGRNRDRRGSPRRFPPPREKEHRQPNNPNEFPPSDAFFPRRRTSRPPPLLQDELNYRLSSPQRSPTPSYISREQLSRPPSRFSFASRGSRESSLSREPHMQTRRPIQSVVDDSVRSPSPFRPIPNFDNPDRVQSIEGESHMHDMRPSDNHTSRRPSRPRVDTQQQYTTSPQYVTPTDSRHGSPQSGSPYGGNRGSWGGQQPQQPYHGQPRQMHGYSPPYRQSTYPPQNASQGQYFQNQQPQYPSNPNHIPPGYPNQPYRGANSTYRGNQYNQPADRRFSGSGSQQYANPPPSQRSRNSHYNNLHWTPSNGRGRGGPSDHSGPQQHGPLFQPPHNLPAERISPEIEDDDNPFRPSKDLQVEDQESTENFGSVGTNMPPPTRQQGGDSQPKETGKFSFAFKSKTSQQPTPKPIPDLTQRMRGPPRPNDAHKNRQQSGSNKMKHDGRMDRRDDRRDGHGRRGDRRFDHREDRRRSRRDERRMEARHEKRTEKPMEREMPKKRLLTRMKPRPTLPEEYAQSDSVYYRKPGNESVVGAGTYGKVFKAVHVFTKGKVALKRIRMEGEKDGFPITAVREIRLLQHLRHENVVSLQEVMVEKNECFMVFEYLSHDLTGLINHPSFTLSQAHKKHLAKQMFEGLNYLHHRGVLHRDIKAANILISSDGQLKYADFGLARFFSKSRQLDYTNRVITIWYRPPELLLGETQYGPAVDVWSAACVYMEMFTKKAIFPGDGSEINQVDKLYNSLGTPTRTDWPDIIDMPWFELMRPTERKKRVFEELYQDCLSPCALDMVAKIFQYDATKRPSAEDVLAHPYFTAEEPTPQQAIELADVEGDWHEFESKAHRKEKDKEARRAEQREREKRKLGGNTELASDREQKRTKVDESGSGSLGLEN